MKRRVYAELLEWKDSVDRRPLLLEGVRHCGKTYILKEFGRNEFESMVYVDLERNEKMRGAFGDDISPREVIRTLEILTNRRIVIGKTLLIIDEIQSWPRALTALKYFHQDLPEFHVVGAGSLSGRLTSKDYSFPVGQLDRIRMYPMTFLEFLDANGQESLSGYLETKPRDQPVDPAVHDRLVSYLREYYVTGGLPAAVGSWVKHHRTSAVTRILKTIDKDCISDFAKHAEDLLPELTELWSYIPESLSKENTEFEFSHVCKGKRTTDIAAALQWMVDAGLIYRLNSTEIPSIPLSTNEDATSFKIYMFDIGLLRVKAGKKASFEQTDDPYESFYKGGMTENYVLTQMLAGGAENAVYWRSKGYEVDFLIAGDDGPVPVEVKAEEVGRYNSLKRYLSEFDPGDSVLVSMEPAAGEGIIRVPLYGACLIPGYVSGEEPDPPSRPVQSQPYRMFFSETDWMQGDGGFSMTIRAIDHGNPIPSVVQVYSREADGYSEVIVDKTISRNGDVTIRSNSRFEGFVSLM